MKITLPGQSARQREKESEREEEKSPFFQIIVLRSKVWMMPIHLEQSIDRSLEGKLTRGSLSRSEFSMQEGTYVPAAVPPPSENRILSMSTMVLYLLSPSPRDVYQLLVGGAVEQSWLK